MLSKLISLLKLGSSSNEIYTSCKELPLYIFLKVYNSDDFTLLIIKGKPTIDELQTAWNTIYSEYQELCKDKSQDYLLKCIKDISFLGNKLYMIETIIHQLMISRNQILIDELHSMGFKFLYEIFGSERYNLELRLTVTQSKQILFRLRQRQQELDELKKRNNDSGTNEFDFLLTELSKFQGYRIDPHVVTVAEFCAIINRFKEANKPKK